MMIGGRRTRRSSDEIEIRETDSRSSPTSEHKQYCEVVPLPRRETGQSEGRSPSGLRATPLSFRLKVPILTKPLRFFLYSRNIQSPVQNLYLHTSLLPFSPHDAHVTLGTNSPVSDLQSAVCRPASESLGHQLSSLRFPVCSLQTKLFSDWQVDLKRRHSSRSQSIPDLLEIHLQIHP